MTTRSARAWRLRVLGGLSIESASTDDFQRHRLEVMLQRRQTLVLLAILGIAGPAGVSREVLLDLLWADGDTARTRNSLAQLLFRTRRALGAEVVVGRGTLRLNDEVISTDVAEFRRAFEAGQFADAVARYSGPLLASLHLADTPALERWVARERARLEEAYRRAVEEADDQSARARFRRGRALMAHGGKAAGLLVIVASIVALPSLIDIHRDTVRRPAMAIVTPFENETGDTSFDRMCRLGGSVISAALANSRLADTLPQRAPEANARDAAAVRASLFRIGEDSLALFVRIVRTSDGRILMAEKPLVVQLARGDQLIALARQRVLAYFSADKARLAGRQ